MREIKKTVDLSCDLGEGFGDYSLGSDEDILRLISSANVACGFHAADPHVMRRTVTLAKKHSVQVGAHPGLPDLVGFGRRVMQVSPAELKDMVTYQLGALRGFVEATGMKLQHVIQHGALTRMAEQDELIGRAILESIRETDPNLYYAAMEGSYLPEMAKAMGFQVVMIAFADRAYDKDKHLVPRKVPGAILHDVELVAQRVEQLITRGEVRTLDGMDIPLEFDSIMLHGDSPSGLKAAEIVVKTLGSLNVKIRPMNELF